MRKTLVQVKKQTFRETSYFGPVYRPGFGVLVPELDLENLKITRTRRFVTRIRPRLDKFGLVNSLFTKRPYF